MCDTSYDQGWYGWSSAHVPHSPNHTANTRRCTSIVSQYARVSPTQVLQPQAMGDQRIRGLQQNLNHQHSIPAPKPNQQPLADQRRVVTVLDGTTSRRGRLLHRDICWTNHCTTPSCRTEVIQLVCNEYLHAGTYSVLVVCALHRRKYRRCE